jgi:TolB protein
MRVRRSRWWLAMVFVSSVAAFGTSASAGTAPGRIAFNLGPDLYSMKPDGSNVKQLTNLGSQNIVAFWESWSFDGSQLVFVEFPPNGPSQLWLMNADGSNPHKVFDDGNFQDYAPSFAPDGSHLIFTRCQPNWPAFATSCAIYSVSSGGSGLTPITHFSPAVNEWEANYSPDGKSISFEAFELGGFLAAVYVMNPDGTNIHRITKPAPCAVDANWSPDSKRVAVWTVECNFGADEIWTMNADGTGIKHLTSNKLPIEAVNPSWSPDGNFIAYERDNIAKGTSAIVVVGADGKGERQILEIPASARSAQRYRSIGRKRAAELRPREIEQGGSFPKWGAAQ